MIRTQQEPGKGQTSTGSEDKEQDFSPIGTQGDSVVNPSLTAVPAFLRELDQWVVWRLQERNDRPTKVPYDLWHNPAKANDPTTWGSFDRAVTVLAHGEYDGIGFMLQEENGLVGVDLDHCRDQATGEIQPWATLVIETLDTYAEVSPSGTGLHLWMLGSIPRNRKLTKPCGIEAYDSVRFLTVTGECVHNPGELATPGKALVEWYEATFPVPEPALGTGSVQESPALEDDEVLQLIRKARNAAKFEGLWNGDLTNYEGSHSEADLALVSLLAFYTQDREQLDRLVRASGLNRQKWSRDDYRDRTLDLALSSLRATFGGVVVERELTDLGNASRMLHRFGSKLRWNNDTGRWLVWNETYWEPDNRNLVLGMAQTTALKIHEELGGLDPDSPSFKKIQGHMRSSQNAPKCKAMVEQLKALPGVTVLSRDLDTDPMLLNCPNGTLNLQTGKLQPHDPADLITQTTGAAYVPGAWSAVWERYLGGVFVENAEDLLPFLQRLAGYTLTGLTSEEVVMLLLGGGGSGKSTFAEALAKAMGSYAATAPVETFLHDRNRSGGAATPELLPLVKARFVRVAEPDEGRRFDASRLKLVSGGDVMTARGLYRDQFDFLPQFKLWVLANKSPEAKASDTGLWRRLLRLPFEHARPNERDRDPSVKAALLDPALSGEAVLAWAVEGCLHWQRDGLRVPGLVTKKTQQLREEMDVTGEFLDEFCTFEVEADDPTPWSVLDDLWTAYTTYCSREGRRPDKRLEFQDRLRSRGAEPVKLKHDGRTLRVWKGVKLLGSSLFEEGAAPRGFGRPSHAGQDRAQGGVRTSPVA